MVMVYGSPVYHILTEIMQLYTVYGMVYGPIRKRDNRRVIVVKIAFVMMVRGKIWLKSSSICQINVNKVT